MTVFGLYGEYYDMLYKDKDYSGEAVYIGDLIRKYAPTATSILDMGCGTGLHAAMLAAQDFFVLGVDMSQSMLNAAEARKSALSPELASRLDFQLGDARSYRAGKKFDVVVSLFHVFSYQNTNADLQAAFETAASNLRPGGILIFDYWYGPAVLTQRPEVRVKRLENDKCRVLRVAEPELLPDQNIVNVNYLLLIDSLVDDRSERISEKHGMRYLFMPEIELLSASQFHIHDHFAWMTQRSPGFEDWAALSVLELKT